MKAYKDKSSRRCPKLTGKLAMLIALVVVLVIGFWLGRRGSSSEATPSEVAAETETQGQVEVWTCSMHPQIRLPEPGLCPICNMELIPAGSTEESASGMRQLTVSRNAKALMDIEVAPVERKFVTATVRMVGKVDYDETRLAYITAWLPGRLDRLYVDYTGVPVKKGDHMVYLYSPELIGAQEELLQALKAVKNVEGTQLGVMREMTESTVAAAREKLRLWGLKPEQIEQIERTGKVQDHMTIYAPSSGIVIHKNALEGMYVQTGTQIYTIADLSKVWVKLDAYESDLSWLRYGQEVEFTTVSFPGEVFKGTISFIDPILNPVTRTVKVRVDVPNPDGKLKPEMFVKSVVKTNVAAAGNVMDPRLSGKWICPMHPSIVRDQPGECDICEMPLVTTESLGYASIDPEKSEKPLVIPTSAALVTGTRAVVYLELPDTDKPTFEGREVVLGPRAGDYYIVRSGLEEGQRVVTKGNFKIDSALQIKAKPSMMTPEGGAVASGQAETTLPVVTRKQLRAVVAASDVVFDAVEKLDVPQINLAFAELGQTIEQVDMELLEGDFHMLWMEMSMRLNNDAVEGKQAETVEVGKKAAESLKTNIASLKSRFGLTQMESKEPRKPVSPEFSSQLAKVYNAYFDVQQALASDKFEEASTGTTEMNDTLADVDMSLLTGEYHPLWMQHAKSLKEIVSNAAEAEDIEQLRAVFAPLSERLFSIGRDFGAPGESTIYQLECPMALDNQGARWLQQDKETRNPYFGSAMLKCGGVIDIIEPVNDTNAGGHQHD